MLSLFRAVVGFTFPLHGAASLFGVFGGHSTGGAVAFGTRPGRWAALIRSVCGTLVLAGLLTREHRRLTAAMWGVADHGRGAPRA